MRLLIDAKDYFEELYEAFHLANDSIYVLGWDIHTKVDLLPHLTTPPAGPSVFQQLIPFLTKRRPNLQIYILTWKYSLIYALERDPFLEIIFDWRTSKNLHFKYDSAHPLGASQHQKMVIIDNTVAYCGGIDLTIHRWDDCDHLPHNPQRMGNGHGPYPPFHDIQLKDENELTSQFSTLFRQRWRMVTGKEIQEPKHSYNEDLLKSDRGIKLQTTSGQIIRTVPTYMDMPPREEIKKAYIKLIRQAKKVIYIENQFFTSAAVGKALEETLNKENPPEVIILLPKRAGGWLEQETMGRLQSKQLQRIRHADVHQKLRIIYPDDARLRGEEYITVHSKLMLVDNRWLIVGSANLNNRSMGLDFECNVLLEGKFEETLFDVINHFLQVNILQLKRRFAEGGRSYLALIDAFSQPHGHKYFRPLQETPKLYIPDEFVANLQFIDLDCPDRIDKELAIWEQESRRKIGFFQRFSINMGLLSTVGVAIVLALLWNHGPLKSLLDNNFLFGGSPTDQLFSSLIIMSGIFMVSGLLFVPLNLLILITAVTFEAKIALLIIFLGVPLNGFMLYLLGKNLKKNKMGEKKQRGGV